MQQSLFSSIFWPECKYLCSSFCGAERSATLCHTYSILLRHDGTYYSYSRPSGAVLGKFSLNLKDSTANSPVAKSLEKVVKSVLPKVHAIPMTLANLNTNYFYPRGEEQLCSGMLQVTRGTLLLLDETAMEEGTLVDQGNVFLYLLVATFQVAILLYQKRTCPPFFFYFGAAH